MRAGAATAVLGAVLLSMAPAAQADPGDPTDAKAALVVHTTVTTAQPRRGEAVSAQVWVSATGAAAENTTLSFSAEPRSGVRITAVCTLTAQGYCKLGDVDAAGSTVPFTIEVPAGTAPLTLTLGAFTRADNVSSTGEYTKITFARTARTKSASPKATPSATASGQSSSPSPSTGSSPLPSVVLPSTTAGAQTPLVASAPTTEGTLDLPAIAPTGSPSPSGYLFTAQPEATLSETELAGREVPPALALGQSIWLGMLLAACALAAALAFRRGARIRRRPEDPDATGRHRPKSA